MVVVSLEWPDITQSKRRPDVHRTYIPRTTSVLVRRVSLTSLSDEELSQVAEAA